MKGNLWASFDEFYGNLLPTCTLLSQHDNTKSPPIYVFELQRCQHSIRIVVAEREDITLLAIGADASTKS